MDYPSLMKEAVLAREKAYAPYSGFYVGAALLAKSGKVYHGCNIENAGYTPTNCAERTAIFKAVSEGEHDFAAIAVVGGQAETGPQPGIFPCGVCRQVLAEFCPPEFPILIGTSENDYHVYTFSELLPQSFGPGQLKNG